MSTWRRTLDVSDVFHNDSIEAPAKFKTISERVRRLNPFDMTLWDIADDIASAGDVNAFDRAWSEFYDWADDARVWVKTR